MTFKTGETSAALLRGFTITGGVIIKNSLTAPRLTDLIIAGHDGSSIPLTLYGGVLCSNFAKPTLRNVTITNNRNMIGLGDAIYCENNADLTLENSIVYNNGGSGGTDIHLDNATITVTDSDVEGLSGLRSSGSFTDGGAILMKIRLLTLITIPPIRIAAPWELVGTSFLPVP